MERSSEMHKNICAELNDIYESKNADYGDSFSKTFAEYGMVAPLLRLADAGYDITFHVHDEIIAETPEGSRWEDMAKIMSQTIDWEPGLLLRADGYETKFYRKD